MNEVELAQEEGLAEGEYPVWSPYDAHEATATLLQLLEQHKAEAPGHPAFQTAEVLDAYLHEERDV